MTRRAKPAADQGDSSILGLNELPTVALALGYFEALQTSGIVDGAKLVLGPRWDVQGEERVLAAYRVKLARDARTAAQQARSEEAGLYVEIPAWMGDVLRQRWEGERGVDGVLRVFKRLKKALAIAEGSTDGYVHRREPLATHRVDAALAEVEQRLADPEGPYTRPGSKLHGLRFTALRSGSSYLTQVAKDSVMLAMRQRHGADRLAKHEARIARAMERATAGA